MDLTFFVGQFEISGFFFGCISQDFHSKGPIHLQRPAQVQDKCFFECIDCCNRDIVGYLRDILYLASPKKGEVVNLNTRRSRSFDGRDSQTCRPKRNVPRVRLR